MKIVCHYRLGYTPRSTRGMVSNMAAEQGYILVTVGPGQGPGSTSKQVDVGWEV